ncbi:RTA-like protein [Lipomyces tetrasporus]|uniref:RTA-like protein n=1 Tax=Lipomyces tetrasporus TaxID=54092 RepID=A0AAD7VQQ2_9ASCO|nr:RTA-like protein [Lipomyces tetrasporus]KAJ8098111.1 RTA-like protein [Lipomyces tetrasporus]
MTYYKYYHYDPSLAGACIFAVLFGLSTAWHIAQIFIHRTWYLIPVVIGGVFEIIGYVARAVSNAEAPHLTLGPYVIQTLLLLVAPPLFAASIYMILGRIILDVDGESYSLIKRRWLTKIFVTSDVVCFFIQLAGAGLMASSQASTSETGSDIVLVGLWVQIAIFAFFIVVALLFDRRLRAMPTRKSQDASSSWRKCMSILYATCALILIRNIVRVAEFIEGFEGYIILHEVFLYVFDAVPMAAVIVTFNIWYPAKFFNQTERVKEDEPSVGSSVELQTME